MQAGFGRSDFHIQKFFTKVTRGTSLLHTYYFTAPLSRTAPQKSLAIQSGRLNALKASANTTVHLGSYHKRDVLCKECGKTFISYSEKGTDVSTAIKLVECAFLKSADVLFFVSG